LLNVDLSRRAHPERKRIAFQAYSVHLAQFFVPVISKLREEAPEFDLHFIVLPHPQFSWSSLQALRAYVRDHLQIPDSNIHYFWKSLWHKYDLIVCTDVYAKFPLRYAPKVFLNHGPGIARRLVQRHPLRKTVFDFDLVLLAGEEDLDLMRRICPGKFVDQKVRAAGFPYSDRLRTCSGQRDAYLRRLGLEPNRATVLLAPSWRGLQALHAREPGFLAALLSNVSALNANVLVKPHACSFNKAMTQGVDWDRLLRGSIGGNIRLDDNVDDVPALQYADVLISDISSRSYNFMLLDKPVILLVPEGLFADPLDRKRIAHMQQAAFTSCTVNEVQARLIDVLRRQPSQRSNRLQLAQRCFANPGCASGAVVGHLLSQISRSQPARGYGV
jgi:hypothetical protein